MKILKLFGVLCLLLLLFSCSGDDDICLGGEATPRLKMKFKTKATGKMKTLDSVFVKVEYGNGPVQVISSKVKTDSVLVPLRVDDTPVTKLMVGLSRAAVNSEIEVKYETKSAYVSPACGVRKVYENVRAELTKASAVVGLELNQTQITDESKTHLYLLF